MLSYITSEDSNETTMALWCIVAQLKNYYINQCRVCYVVIHHSNIFFQYILLSLGSLLHFYSLIMSCNIATYRLININPCISYTFNEVIMHNVIFSAVKITYQCKVSQFKWLYHSFSSISSHPYQHFNLNKMYHIYLRLNYNHKCTALVVVEVNDDDEHYFLLCFSTYVSNNLSVNAIVNPTSVL